LLRERSHFARKRFRDIAGRNHPRTPSNPPSSPGACISHHLYADKPGDVHSPHYDGVGNRYVGFVKGMMHAQGSWVFDHVATDGEYYAKDILADPIAMFCSS
jgi:hypothetical protein